MSIAALLFAAPLTTATADMAADNAALRAEVAKLKAQLEQAQKSCPAANAAVPATPATAGAAAAVPSPTVAAPPVSSAAAPAPVAAPPPTAPPAVPTPPPGYKLVKVETPVVHDDRWKNPQAWNRLQTDMTPEQVESLLGIEHSSVSKRGQMSWGYGLLAGQPVGRVIFVDGKVTLWRAPDE